MALSHNARMAEVADLKEQFEGLFARGEEPVLVALVLYRAAQIRMVDFIDVCEQQLLTCGFNPAAIHDIIRFEQAPISDREKAVLAWVEVALEPRATNREATTGRAEQFVSKEQLAALRDVMDEAVRISAEISSTLCPPDEMRER